MVMGVVCFGCFGGVVLVIGAVEVVVDVLVVGGGFGAGQQGEQVGVVVAWLVGPQVAAAQWGVGEL